MSRFQSTAGESRDLLPDPPPSHVNLPPNPTPTPPSESRELPPDRSPVTWGPLPTYSRLRRNHGKPPHTLTTSHGAPPHPSGTPFSTGAPRDCSVNSVQRPSHVRLTDLSTPSQRRINTPEAVSTLSTPYQHRGKTWEGLPKTSPGGLATTWPGGCPAVQCQSRGAGCRCTGVQWSRSAQVLIRTRAHLTFRFYFHPRTAISRLQNAPCLRQTCPFRFKNAIWRGPRRVPSQESIFRVPSQRPN